MVAAAVDIDGVIGPLLAETRSVGISLLGGGCLVFLESDKRSE